MANLYSDQRISCTEDGITIQWYYLWGPKTIPYSDIEGVERVRLSFMRGKWRLWGTADPRYWASFDPGRHRKPAGLILELGKGVRPFITPDDVPAVEEILKEHAGFGEVIDKGDAPCM